MAQNTDTSSNTPDTSGFETSVGSDTSWSMDVESGDNRGKLQTSAEEAAEWDEEGEQPGEAQDGDQQPVPEEGESPTDEAPEAAATPEPLPDYDQDNEEVVKQYEETYYKDGKLNQEALTKEFWSNHEKDPENAGLNEGTYKYLEALGLDRDMVKSVEQGQLALFASQQREADRAFFAKVEGGKQGFEAAFRWAQTESGYTKDMKERFNKALQAGGAEYEEAVDSLMARFKRAGGVIPGGGGGGRGNKDRSRLGGRRASSPARTATGQGASGSGSARGATDVFETRESYVSAWKEVLANEADARRSGDRTAIKEAMTARDAVRAKVRRSPSWNRAPQQQ